MDGTTDPIRRYHPEVSLVPGHLQPFVTVVVLISGVAGGLILVISVILICKYCFKQKKALKRKPAAYLSSAEEGSSPFVRKYDSTEPSEIQNLYSADLEKDIEDGRMSPRDVERPKAAEEEEDNIDYYFQQYQEMLKDGNGNPVESPVVDEEKKDSEHTASPSPSPSRSAVPTPRSSIVSAPASGPPSPPNEAQKELPREPSPPPAHTQVRRVSFQDEEHQKRRALCISGPPRRPPFDRIRLPRGRSYDVSDPPSLVRNWSFRRDSKKKSPIRYTDGDYHYLKRMRIQRPGLAATNPLFRQYSVGGLSSSNNIKVQERYIRSMTDDPTYHHATMAYDVPTPEPPVLVPRRDSYRDPSTNCPPLDSYRDPSMNCPPQLDSYRDPSMNCPPLDSYRDPSPHCSPRDSYRDPSPNCSPLDSYRGPSPHCSPIVQHKVTKTEVRALVHRSSTSNSSLETKSSPPERVKRAIPPRNLALYPASARHSFSVEMVGPVDVAVLGRRVKSYECGLRDDRDYESSNLIQFDKGPFYNADFDVVSEGGGSPNFRSKVRYNDTGSLEEIAGDAAKVMLNEIITDIHMSDRHDDTDTLNGTQKYRDIWSLRATLEEEEDFSDTIRIEDISSPEPSPDHELALSIYTTSFESNTEVCPYADLTDSELGSRNHLHPHENRRQNYKSILSRRFRKIDARPPVGENSFDSVETMDTDGDVSDTSRPVDTTTSFESTTDNTDSTGDSQTHKLQQMKHDSGYRSLESTQQPKLSKKLHFAVEQDSIECEEVEAALQSDKLPVDLRVVESHVKRGARTSRDGQIERRNGRTASKKRREFSRERQLVQVYESINEPETDSRSDLPSGDSFDDPATPSKFSVFSRFFKSHHRERVRLTRDYSIDEKTNRIFNEYLRPEQSGAQPRVRSPRTRRLQRKFTDPSAEFIEYPRNKLCPEMRSTSLGSDSSCASSRRLSPQDSVEDDAFPRDLLMKPVWDTRITQAENTVQAGVSIQDIPIIRLPEEEISDV